MCMCLEIDMLINAYTYAFNLQRVRASHGMARKVDGHMHGDHNPMLCQVRESLKDKLINAAVAGMCG
jgi:hypothetical protein